MPPVLVNALREWKLACPKSELGLVFPTGAGEVEYHSNIVTRGLAPVLVAANVVAKAGKAKYTRSDFGCDLIEVKLHSFGVAGRQHEGGAGSAFGADRTEQVGRLGPLIVGGTGA